MQSSLTRPQDMDASHFPPSMHSFIAAASLAQHEEDLDLEHSHETQGIQNYESYIFRISETPAREAVALNSIKSDVYHLSHPQAEERHVALLSATLLTRPSVTYLKNANKLSDELTDFATTFYSVNRKINKLCKAHRARIADTGDGFLAVRKLEVTPEHRGIDLGLQLLHQTLIFLKHRWSVAVIHPRPLSLLTTNWHIVPPSNNTTADQSIHQAKLLRHFARLGFVQASRDVRRANFMYLTGTKFFSSNNETLPRIPKEEAYKIVVYSPTKHEPKGLDKSLHELITCEERCSSSNPDPIPLQPAEHQEIERFLYQGASVHESRALHSAVRRNADPGLLQLLISYGGDINAPDESGNRPLHIAASEISASIPHLIKLEADRNVVNNNNETPFDLLEYAIEVDDISAGKEHNSKSQTRNRKMENLRNALIVLLPEQLRSQLVDGSLSPRMHKMLITSALHASSAIQEIVDVYQGDTHRPVSHLSTFSSFLKYFPEKVLRRQDFLIDWKQVFIAIALCLNCEKVPTVERVRRILNHDTADSPAIENFFERGGRIEYALDALLCITENMVEDIRYPDLWSYNSCQLPDIETLPATPLDDLCNVARAMCFHGSEEIPYSPYGPYDATKALFE